MSTSGFSSQNIFEYAMVKCNSTASFLSIVIHVRYSTIEVHKHNHSRLHWKISTVIEALNCDMTLSQRRGVLNIWLFRWYLKSSLIRLKYVHSMSISNNKIMDCIRESSPHLSKSHFGNNKVKLPFYEHELLANHIIEK